MARRSRIRARWLEAAEWQRERLAGRLQRHAGPAQLAEIIRGTLASDEDWRDWCREVLAAQPDLLDKVYAAASEVGPLEQKATQQRVRFAGTDVGGYWTADEDDSEFEAWMGDRVDAGQLSQTRATTLRRLREARLTRLACLPWLAGDLSDASQAIFEAIFEAGCPEEVVAASRALAKAEDRCHRLLDLTQRARACVLQPILKGAKALAAQHWDLLDELVQAARERLRALRDDPDTDREMWLLVARGLLPPGETACRGLSELGRVPDDPVRDAALQVLSDANAEQQAIILLALTRWLDLVEGIRERDDTDLRTTPEIGAWVRGRFTQARSQDDKIRETLWSAVLMPDVFPTTEHLHEVVVATLAVTGEELEKQPETADRSAHDRQLMWRVLTDLQTVASATCGPASAPLLIRGLQFEDPETYGAAFNGLLRLADKALPALGAALRSEEAPRAPILRLLERMEAESAADDVALCLDSDEASVRNQAVRVLRNVSTVLRQFPFEFSVGSGGRCRAVGPVDPDVFG